MKPAASNVHDIHSTQKCDYGACAKRSLQQKK